MLSSRVSTDAQSIKIEASKYMTKFQEKINSFINYQDNLIKTQIDQIKQVLQENQDRIGKQKLSIDELSDKISTVQVRTQSKILLLSKQLNNFRSYYDQCFQYTVTRINQVSNKMNCFVQQIKNLIQSSMPFSAVQYVKYALDLVTNIVKKSAIDTSDLKFYLDEELYQLEIQLGKFTSYVQDIEKGKDELKMAKYENQSIAQLLMQIKKFIEEKGESGMKDSHTGKKITNFYQQKIKQIIKKINTQSVEVEMIKLMVKNENNQISQKKQQWQKQYTECEAKLRDLQKQVGEEKILFEKQMAKKEQLLKKRHDRILELEESLHLLLQKQIKMQHQISQVKLHNLELTRQIKKLSQKNANQLAIQANQKQMVGKEIKNQKRQLKRQPSQGLEQKLLILQLQYQNLLQKYNNQSQLLTKLGKSPSESKKQFERVSCSQRLIEKPNALQNEQKGRSKSRNRDTSSSKTLNKNYSDSKTSIKSSKNIQNQYKILLYEKQKLSKMNEQLNKINKQLEDQIRYLLNKKSQENKQDQEYVDDMEQEIQKYNMEIQQLEEQVLALSRKNASLQAENERIQIQCNNQIVKYEQKVKSLQRITFQLEKQNQTLKARNQKLMSQLSQGENVNQIKNLYATRSLSPIVKKIQTNGSEVLDQKNYKTKQKKSKNFTNFLIHLQNAILGMGLPIPICIEIDKNGYIREQKTSSYLVDENKNPIHLSQNQLRSAILNGLILI